MEGNILIVMRSTLNPIQWRFCRTEMLHLHIRRRQVHLLDQSCNSRQRVKLDWLLMLQQFLMNVVISVVSGSKSSWPILQSKRRWRQTVCPAPATGLRWTRCPRTCSSAWPSTDVSPTSRASSHPSTRSCPRTVARSFAKSQPQR